MGPVFAAPSSLCLLGFFLTAVLSVVFSEFSFYGWQFFRLINLGILVLLSVILSSRYTFPDFSKLLKKLFTAIVLLSCYQAVLALMQYTSQAPVGVLGEVDFAALGKEASIFEVHPLKRWIFDGFGILNLGAEGYLFRPYGSLPHPNILAGVVFIGSFATLYLFSLVQGGWKWGLLLAMIAQVLTIFVSYSRSATIAWMVMFVFWLFWRIKLSQKYTMKSQKLWLSTKISIGACLCLFLFYQQNSVRGLFIQRNAQEDFISTSSFFKEKDRVENQTIAFRMIQESPLFGVGFENYMLKINKYIDEGIYSRDKVIFPVHNIYLLISVEMGLVAAIFFVGYLVIVLLKSRQHSLESMDRVVLLCIFLGLLFIGFCDFYLVIFQQGRVFLFILPAVFLRSVQLQKTQELLGC